MSLSNQHNCGKDTCGAAGAKVECCKHRLDDTNCAKQIMFRVCKCVLISVDVWVLCIFPVVNSHSSMIDLEFELTYYKDEEDI